jgi:enamine deaminase RidA (YjgF/YER057c/UK114 family)
VDKTIINAELGKGWSMFEGAPVDQLIHSDGVIVELAEATLVFASGKTSTDERGELVHPGDIYEQTRQVLRNLRGTLAAAGGTLDDVVRVRVYVAQPMTREDFFEIHRARSEFFAPEHYPASTLVIVHALVRPDALIEIDADAVIRKR